MRQGRQINLRSIDGVDIAPNLASCSTTHRWQAEEISNPHVVARSVWTGVDGGWIADRYRRTRGVRSIPSKC